MYNPYEVKTVKCAYCGTVRQEANHWFVITMTGSGFRCAPLKAQPSSGHGDATLTIRRRLRKSEQPACGQQCAQKVFERYLAQEGTMRAQKMPAYDSWRESPNPPSHKKEICPETRGSLCKRT